MVLALYNAFLAPNAPCELNIDHTLRNKLALCMVRPLGNEDTMLRNLQEVVELFELAQHSVYKLMSSVRRLAIRFLPPSLTSCRIPYRNLSATLALARFCGSMNLKIMA